MSEVLARIRVRETHGIRRFLYPLSVIVEFPEWYEDSASSLSTLMGEQQPSQITPIHGNARLGKRLDFAVFLNPFADIELELSEGTSPVIVNDPLNITEEGGFHNHQQHFWINFGWDGDISKVVYDGVDHLRRRITIHRNGKEASYDWRKSAAYTEGCSLNARVLAHSDYQDGCKAQTRTEISACKSWATITHTLEQPRPNDEIVFTLPLVITARTLTYDFGVGGYVFGKLDEKAPEIVWRTEFGDRPHARWSVATVGRTDYVGEVETAEAFLPQRWFHLIDSDKALAVAITKVPNDCREMTVRMTLEGDISIAFRLGETISGPAEFGVCYHFLNDVPAIAAATNPQSILLPPVVEVLPL